MALKRSAIGMKQLKREINYKFVPQNLRHIGKKVVNWIRWLAHCLDAEVGAQDYRLCRYEIGKEMYAEVRR